MLVKFFRSVVFVMKWLILMLTIAMFWLLLSSKTPQLLAGLVHDYYPQLSFQGVSGHLASDISIDRVTYQSGRYALQLSDVNFELNYDQWYKGKILLNDIEFSFYELSADNDLLDTIFHLDYHKVITNILDSEIEIDCWNQTAEIKLDAIFYTDHTYHHLDFSFKNQQANFDFLSYFHDMTIMATGQWSDHLFHLYGFDNAKPLLTFECVDAGHCAGELKANLSELLSGAVTEDVSVDLSFELDERSLQADLNLLSVMDYQFKGQLDYSEASGLTVDVSNDENQWLSVISGNDFEKSVVSIAIPEFIYGRDFAVSNAFLDLEIHATDLRYGNAMLTQLRFNDMLVSDLKMDVFEDRFNIWISKIGTREVLFAEKIALSGDNNEYVLNAVSGGHQLDARINYMINKLMISSLSVDLDHSLQLEKPIVISFDQAAIGLEDFCMTYQTVGQVCVQGMNLNDGLLHLKVTQIPIDHSFLKYTHSPVLDAFVKGSLSGLVDVSTKTFMPVGGSLVLDDFSVHQRVFLPDISHVFYSDIAGKLFVNLDQEKLYFYHLDKQAEREHNTSMISGLVNYDSDGISKLNIKLDGLSLMDQHDSDIKLKGSLDFSFDPSYWKLDGQIDVLGRRLSIPSFVSTKLIPLDVVIIDDGLANQSRQQLYDVNISLNIQEPILAMLDDIQGQLSGSVHLSKQAGKIIRLTGDLDLTEAKVVMHGVSLDVERATLAYQNDFVDNPFIYLSVYRNLIDKGDSFSSFEGLLDDKIKLVVFGRLQYPKFQIHTDDMSRLSDFLYPFLLKFGQESSNGSSDNILGVFSFVEGIKEFFHLDRLALRPLDAGDSVSDNDFTEGEILVEKALTDKLSFFGSIKRSKDSNYLMSLIYDLNSYLSARVYARSGSGMLGSSRGVDLLYKH